MRRSWIVFGLWLLLAALVQAQQQDTPEAAPDAVAPPPQADQASAGPPADPDAENAEQSPGRFIPTEEISQDLGVSFPVDI